VWSFRTAIQACGKRVRGGLRRLRKLQIDSAVGVVYNHVICPIMYQCRTSKTPAYGRFAFTAWVNKKKCSVSDGFSRDSVIATVAAIFS
jgi:hypothetical protein